MAAGAARTRDSAAGHLAFPGRVGRIRDRGHRGRSLSARSAAIRRAGLRTGSDEHRAWTALRGNSRSPGRPWRACARKRGRWQPPAHEMRLESRWPRPDSAFRSTRPSRSAEAGARRRALSSRSGHRPKTPPRSAKELASSAPAEATERGFARAVPGRTACGSRRVGACVSWRWRAFPHSRRTQSSPRRGDCLVSARSGQTPRTASHGMVLRTENFENEAPKQRKMCVIRGLPQVRRDVTAMGTASDVSKGSKASADLLHYATRTVFFADVVESVRLMQRDELAAARRIRDLLLEAANETIPRHQGHLLQRLDDGLMIAFEHQRHAIECARALHRRAAELAESVAVGDRVLLRIGIHAADSLTDDVAFYGNGVNVAARLAALAGPGETVISLAARDQLTAGPGGEFVDLGLCHLKHVDAPLRAYRLGPRNAQPPEIESQIVLRPTLAVIPLTLLSGGSPSLAVGEIIADEVIVALSRAPELRIVSRLSTTAFRGRKTQLKEIRALLGATYVLSGAYRVSGDTLIVTVELADTRNGDIVWAHGFKSKLSGLLAQDDNLVA